VSLPGVPAADEAGRDVLTEVLRKGARRVLAEAVDIEVQAWLDARAGLTDVYGRRLVVRNGQLPQREVLTGVGPVTVRQPRVRDKRPLPERERFSSAILPPYLRKAKSIEELIPWLYLKGVSTGDFSEALTSLLGENAPGLSATTVTRLKEVWRGEYEAWSRSTPRRRPRHSGPHSAPPYTVAAATALPIRRQNVRPSVNG
jgi:transposase-like protein